MRQSALFLSILKKTLFIFFLLLTTCYVLPTPSAHAQSYTSNLAPGVEKNQHTQVQTLFFDIMSAVGCIAVGIDPISSHGCLGVNPQNDTYSYATKDTKNVGGLIGALTDMSGQFYAIPINTHDYIRSVADNFGIAPHAYAQTQGFSQLQGVQTVWVIFRNLAYLFFVLIFMIIGLGVMLRIKIDPRTVMSIQNQIPRLIVGLILITFSYAIAAIMIDLMWLLTYVVINLAAQADPEIKLQLQKTTNDLILSPIGFSNNFYHDGLRSFSASIAGTIGGVVSDLFTPWYSKVNTNCQIWTTGVEACVRAGTHWLIKLLVESLAFFIAVFALLIALFKIWWQLLKSFAYIVIYTAISPIYIAVGLIPGSTTNFNAWIRGMASNLLVFPATVAFFMGSKIFLNQFNQTPFNPPLTGNPNAAGGFGYIVAFAVIMVAPELINILRDALKSQPSKYIAPSIMRGIQSGAAPAMSGANMYWRTLMRPYDHISRRPAGLLRNALVGSTAGTNRFQRFMNRIIAGSDY